MGWSTFRERHIKATLRYEVRLERRENTKIARKVYLWNVRSSKWEKKCMNMVDRSDMLVRWVHRFCEGRESIYEWKVMNRSREGLEWDVRKWKSEINKTVKGVGVSKCKTEMEQKKTLGWPYGWG